ncbi:hypothetical protein D9M70_538860 [compost metagenome]
MYGCPVGIIFSKLAFSSRRVDCQPSSTVVTRHSSSTQWRWLNRARSTSEPERGSKASWPDGMAWRAEFMNSLRSGNGGLRQARQTGETSSDQTAVSSFNQATDWDP